MTRHPRLQPARFLFPSPTAVLACAIAVVGSILTSASPAGAQLPPPPPPDGGFTFEPPPASPGTPSYGTPTPAPAPTTRAGIYRVQVPANDSQMLWRVQAVVPNAFVRKGEGIIQAGLFSESVNALQLAQDLSVMGVAAQIVPLNGAPPIASTPFESGLTPPGQLPAPPVPSQPGTSPVAIAPEETARFNPIEGRMFFVTVSASPEEVETVAAAVQAAGAFPCTVQSRELDGEKVVTVGPFPSRSVARAWRGELRDAGLDAEIDKIDI
ncbi:hypothetical protein KR51_00033630 [Rubidibacter lacunae KORDI 51-2]|uniref:SPOR domain-containing protein n=1 Tax=Rubidibacter lacunae KORDI 51-2 TaxID=582515 RepID=U5D600_9CHRO|nr:SPOR domain-containing protein [Rubidibacter lacunae]ERN40078.1 hypothetical protein KR51_00033630 [Rubidibacter lacunae KORDI 51-2]